jgi:hypothetical protein
MNYQNAERVLSKLLPDAKDFVFLLIFIGAFYLGPRMMNVDGDLGRHLTIGEYILENRKIPTLDIFSHTKTGDPVTPHEWLAQVMFAGSHRWMGLSGVVWLSALVLGWSYRNMFVLGELSGARAFSIVVIVLLGALTSSLHWLTRPHLFTLLFFCFWMVELEKVRLRKSNRWWIFPVIMVFWVNFHGAFIAGLLTMMLYLTGQMLALFFEEHPDERKVLISSGKQILAGLVSAIFVTILNPAGWKIWETSIGYVRNRYLVSHTAEYQSPNFHDSSTWPFLFLIVFLVILLGITKHKKPFAVLLTSAGWLAMALYSTRNIPLFVLASTPLIVPAFDHLLQEYSPKKPLALIDTFGFIQNQLKGSMLTWAAIIVLGLASWLQPASLKDRNQFSEDIFPVQAVGWLESNPQRGNVFNHFPWGGYLLYRTWPEMLVFIDGQTDFYGESLTRQYETVITLQEGWQDVLTEYEVSWVLIPVNSSLANQLNIEDGWKVVYQDQTAVIYTATYQVFR